MMFSDSENHSSIIHGIRHSKCEKKIFRHNDLAHLRFNRRQIVGGKGARSPLFIGPQVKIIVKARINRRPNGQLC